MAVVVTRAGTIGIAERGGGAATPLMFLHGVGSNKSAWATQLAAFGAERRTVALDYPGYGDSGPAVPGEGHPHDRFADAVLAAFDALAIERAHLCGLSLGGVVAIAVAHRAPDRVASLIIADSFARHPDGEGIHARSIAASGDMAALALARVPMLLAQDHRPALAISLVEVMAAIDPAAFRLASSAVWTADQRDRARAIAVPTLVLCGTEDRVTPLALSDELAELVPNARLATIADAGHLPNLEQPAIFNHLVAKFLTETEENLAGY